MPAFKQSRLVELVPDVIKLAGEFVGIVGNFLSLFPRRQLCCLENLEHKNGVVRRERPAALRYNIRLRQTVFAAHVNKL